MSQSPPPSPGRSLEFGGAFPPAAPAPVRQVQIAPSARRGGAVPAMLIIIISLAAWWVGRYLLGTLGLASGVLLALVALIPLAICVLALLWVDRWDPEPRSIILLALGWGAAPAVALSLWVGWGLRAQTWTGFASLVEAPVTEEIAKGLGVLLIFLLARKHVYGPVDGVVVGGLIGAGFAFTENILYFAVASQGGAGSLFDTFVGRGLVSPFAHVLFTALTGAAVGWASERGGRLGSLILPWVLGLVPAMLAHLAWNALAEGALSLGFLEGYLVTQVPFFVISVAVAIWFGRREVRLNAAALRDYAAAGWYTQDEVAMLSSPRGRREGRRWAARRGAQASYTHMVRTADQLAVLRQRQLRHPQDGAIAREQAEALHRSMTSREALRAAVAGGPGGWTAS